MIRVRLILIFCLLISLTVSGQEKKKTHKGREITSYYSLVEGRFNGVYTSFYKNGNKRAEGSFDNNLRIGKWTVWDSLGTIRMQRDYSDQFTFKRLIPEVPNDKPIQLLNVPQYRIEYNREGFITYAYVKEAWVHWHKRIWRHILPENNPILFKENRLFKLFNKHILDSAITAYSPVDDEFRKEFVPKIDTSNLKVIAFKIKEDFFFDMNRVVSESRIIGVCPVAININTNDTVDLYWVYHPEIRKFLAQEKIQNDSLPVKIKTLDDLFFYRYFYGMISKESNVYDRTIKEYLTGEELIQEAERIEFSMIEKEHDIWISLSKQPK